MATFLATGGAGFIGSATIFGYTPQTGVREGLRHTVEWHRTRLSLIERAQSAALGASA
jgi:dTDP-D-glucose 4,6-dehydratase